MARKPNIPPPSNFGEDSLLWRELSPSDWYALKRVYLDAHPSDLARNDVLLYGGFVNHRYMMALVVARHEPDTAFNQIELVWVNSEWQNKGIELGLCLLIRDLDPTRPTSISTKDDSFAKILTKGGFKQIDETLYAIRAKTRDTDPAVERRRSPSTRPKKRPKNPNHNSS